MPPYRNFKCKRLSSSFITLQLMEPVDIVWSLFVSFLSYPMFLEG
jgi:hypothetical protein